MTNQEVMDMQLRLEVLKLAHEVVGPSDLVDTIIKTANDYYKFVKEGVTPNE